MKNQAPSAIHLDFSSQELYWQTDATSTINIIEPLSILIHQPPSCSIHQLQTPVINQERSSTINYYQPSFINYQPQAEHRNSIHVLLIRPSKGCEGNQGEVAAHWTATGWNRIINSWSTILGASWIADPRIDQALCTEPWNCMVGWENGMNILAKELSLGVLFPMTSRWCGKWWGLAAVGTTLISDFVTMEIFRVENGDTDGLRWWYASNTLANEPRNIDIEGKSQSWLTAAQACSNESAKWTTDLLMFTPQSVFWISKKSASFTSSQWSIRIPQFCWLEEEDAKRSVGNQGLPGCWVFFSDVGIVIWYLDIQIPQMHVCNT